MAAAASDRFRTIATYAAESGVAAGLAYLREQYTTGTYWTSLVSPGNADPEMPEAVPGNGLRAGQGGLFSDGSESWYEVTVLNNPTDPGFAAGTDADGRLILRATGYGPTGATAIVEVEVISSGSAATIGNGGRGYTQETGSETNSGLNDLLSDLDGTATLTTTTGS
jgi:hypothetical protein